MVVFSVLSIPPSSRAPEKPTQKAAVDLFLSGNKNETAVFCGCGDSVLFFVRALPHRADHIFSCVCTTAVCQQLIATLGYYGRAP